MLALIGSEIKKRCFKPVILIFWGLLLFLTPYLCKGENYSLYADLFYKYYGIMPMLGLIMFSVYSASYTQEYNSNMYSLIKTTKNGKKKIVHAKWIGLGLFTSIINLSVFFANFVFIQTKLDFKLLNEPINKLWYLSKVSIDMTILQLIIITIITTILGSFLFAQIGVTLSSLSKSSVVPFFVGGLIMGIPYIFPLNFFNINFALYTPLYGMNFAKLIATGADPLVPYIVNGIIFIVLMILLPKIAYKAFNSETK